MIVPIILLSFFLLAGPECAGAHLSRADGLTQLAGDAVLLSIGVAAEGVLSTEAGGQRALLKRVVDGGRFTEQVTHGHPQTCRKVRVMTHLTIIVDVIVNKFH